jgi:hypothetical protein
MLSQVFSIEQRGRDLFAAAERLDLEGIVAKRKADADRPETVWYKIKSRTYSQSEGRWELFQKRAYALSAWFIGLAYFFSASLPLFSTCSGRPRYTGRESEALFVLYLEVLVAAGLPNHRLKEISKRFNGGGFPDADGPSPVGCGEGVMEIRLG